MRKKIRLFCVLLIAAVFLCALMPEAEAESLGRLAVERDIYWFLREEMGLNTAAASGILANIEYESAFQTDIWGDGGTSYGICQWHASRFDNLRLFCTSRGLNYQSLEGQLRFLQYELKTTYLELYGRLLHVDDTADGAYQAGYWWCVIFERPVEPERKGVIRGNQAELKYFRRYQSMPERTEIIWTPSDYDWTPQDGIDDLTDLPPDEFLPETQTMPTEPGTADTSTQSPENAVITRKHRPAIRRFEPFVLPRAVELPKEPVESHNAGYSPFPFILLGDDRLRFCRLPEPEEQETES